MVADPLEGTRDDDHPQAVLPHLRVAAELENARDDPAVRAVDELVEVDEGLGPFEVAVAERIERDPDHLLTARPHLFEALDETRPGVDLRHELGELRDRHAVVRHSLEVQVDMKDCEHEAKIAGDRRLSGQQELNPLFDAHVPLVDVVVEGDHFVR